MTTGYFLYIYVDGGNLETFKSELYLHCLSTGTWNRDYRWTDGPGLNSTIHCDKLTCIILASLYVMFTNRVLRTSVSFTEDCLVASVDPVIVDAHLRVSQAIKAWLCWRQRHQ